MPISSFFARRKRATLASRHLSCDKAGYVVLQFSPWPRPTRNVPIFPSFVKPQARRLSGRRWQSRSVQTERVFNDGENNSNDPLALFEMKPASSCSSSPLSFLTRTNKNNLKILSNQSPSRFLRTINQMFILMRVTAQHQSPLNIAPRLFIPALKMKINQMFYCHPISYCLT